MSNIIEHQLEEVEFIECPDCFSKIPVDIGYITWCECGYNLNRVKEEVKKSSIDRLYERLGEKSGHFVFNKMMNEINFMPKITVVNGLALLLATIVHFFSLASFLLGVYLLIFHYLNFINIFWGLLLVGFAWFTRPKVNKLKDDERIVPRQSMPTSYAIMDDLAKSMGVKKIDGIIINDKYNASISKISWKRKTIVTIGIPLFASLTPEEQCTIIAHELGHYLNKDLTYGFYIGTALETLHDWTSLLEPIPSERTFEVTILDMVTNLLMKILAYLPYLFYSLLLHLIWNDSQKGEYLADYCAAQFCGSKQTINALEKLNYGDLFYHALSKVSLNNDKTNVIDEFRKMLDTMPAREKQRYKLRCSREKFKLDESHPPTAYRIQFIEKQNLPGRFSIDTEKVSKMAEELDKMKEEIHEIAVENYRYNLLG